MARFCCNVPFQFQTRGHTTTLHSFIMMLPSSSTIRQFLSPSLLFMTDNFEEYYFIAQSPIYIFVFSRLLGLNWILESIAQKFVRRHCGGFLPATWHREGVNLSPDSADICSSVFTYLTHLSWAFFCFNVFWALPFAVFLENKLQNSHHFFLLSSLIPEQCEI